MSQFALNVRNMAEEATLHTGISPLAVLLAIGGPIWLYRLWRPSRDRNLSKTFYESTLPVGLILIAVILLPPPGPKWLGFIVGWSPILIIGVLLCAGAVQARRDRKADERRRAAMNLARRRRMLTQAQLTVVWVVGACAALFGFLIVASVVLVAESGDSALTTENVQIGGALGIAFIVIVGIAGCIHVGLRPAKIAREDERLRQLDLGLEDDTSDQD